MLLYLYLGFAASSKDKTCEDIDECVDNEFICGESEYGTCLNTEGAFICACRDGFKNKNGLQSQCIDINECSYFDCGFNNTYSGFPTYGSLECPSFFRKWPISWKTLEIKLKGPQT